MIAVVLCGAKTREDAETKLVSVSEKSDLMIINISEKISCQLRERKHKDNVSRRPSLYIPENYNNLYLK